MTGTIFDIKRFAVHDGPGIRTTVFMKGCPLSCLWCHNPEGISPDIEHVPRSVKIGNKTFSESEQIGREVTPEMIMKDILSDRVFMEESGGGVTFSGGEPLMQYNFLVDVLKACNSEDLHTVVDTTGSVSPARLLEVARYTRLFLYDLKLMDDHQHRKWTGVSNRQSLENLVLLAEKGVDLRVRIPMIPDVTASRENLDALIYFLAELPGSVPGIDLLPFHNTADHKYRRFRMDNHLKNVESLTEQDLLPVKEQFERAGFETRIGG